MKTTIKTSVLKSMMSKVIKGVANNKMLPVTSLIGIEKEDNVLRLMATDSLNTIIVKEQIGENDNFIVGLFQDQQDVFATRASNETIAGEEKTNEAIGR